MKNLRRRGIPSDEPESIERRRWLLDLQDKVFLEYGKLPKPDGHIESAETGAQKSHFELKDNDLPTSIESSAVIGYVHNLFLSVESR